MGGSTHTTSQKYDGIIVQSSLKGIPITKGWGTTKTGCNLIDYLDFTSKKVSSGGKGGGAQPDYDYYATLLLAIGLGPITGIRTIYKDSAYYVAQGSGSKEVNGTTITISAKSPAQAAGLSQIFLGSIWQAPWSYLTSAHSANALGYSGIAYAAAENYNLNTSATVPNFNFEVQWPVQGTIEGVVQDDANPADILNDLLPDVPRWPTGVIASLSTYQGYCYAQGLLLSPQADGGRQASDLITEILTCSNADCLVSEGLFQVVPLGDTAISANGVTYAPNLTPIYSLTYDDILPSSDGEDPIQWDIKPADQCYNYLTVGFLDRTQQYANDSVPAVDQAAVNQFGRNQADPVTYESINLLSVATTVAQIAVQKSANLRRTAKLVVPETFGLLDPMDLVEVPAPNGAPILVRINTANEQADGSIELDVEEMLVGAAHAPLYTRQSGLGIPANFAIDPGDSTAPTIINPPISLTGGQYEVWIATAGGPEWGGCNVWVSLDGDEFYQQATVTQPGRFGVTTADFPAGSDPDTSDTLSVNLSASGGELTTATQAAADAQTTLCAVGTEVIAYSAATLTAPNQYNLGSYIRRGLEGTTAADQPSGSLFLRLDDAICPIPYNTGQVGKTVYVKLQSFNLYGNAFQDLDLCETYTFTAEPNGTSVIDVAWTDIAGVPALVEEYVGSGGVSQSTYAVGTMTAAQVNAALSNLNPLADVSTPNTPPAPTVTFTTALDANGNIIVTLKGTVATATDANIAGYEFLLSVNGGTATLYPTAASQTSFTWQVPAGVSYSLQVREVKLSGVRGSYSSAATGTTTNNLAAPSAPTGLTATGGYGANFLSWTNPSNTDLDHVEVWAATTNMIGSATQIATVASAAGLISSCTHSGLTTGTTWYYWVRAVNSSGNKSGFTGPASAVPVGFPSSALNGPISASQITSITALQISGTLTASQIGGVNADVLSGVLSAANIPSLSALSGQIAQDQLAAGSVGTSQLVVGSVTSSVIAANTIVGGNIAAGTIMGANLVAGTITATQIAANTITAGNIAANTITGSLIAANTITAGLIAAGTLTAAQIAVGTFSNDLVPNGNFAQGLSGWYDLAGTSYVSPTSGPTGGPCAVIALNNGAGLFSSAMPITGGQTYLCTVSYAATVAQTSGFYWRLAYQTAASATYVPANTEYDIISYGPAGGWASASYVWTAPSNANALSVAFYNTNTSGGLIVVANVSVQQQLVGGNIAVGTITAANIAANTITASQIAVGTITAANIAAGTITASQIAVGTITAANIAANTITASQIAVGTITAANIAAGTITASQISASAGITASQLSVSYLSAIAANLGIITAGYLQNGGGSNFLDLTNGRQQYTVGSAVLRVGSIASGILLWFGPSSVALGSESTTNGYWCWTAAGGSYINGQQLNGGSGAAKVGPTSCGANYGSYGGGISCSFGSNLPAGGYVLINVNIAGGGTTNPYGGGSTTAQTGIWQVIATQGSNSTVIASGSWSATGYVSGEGVLQTTMNNSGQLVALPYSGSGIGLELQLQSNSSAGATWIASLAGTFTPPG